MQSQYSGHRVDPRGYRAGSAVLGDRRGVGSASSFGGAPPGFSELLPKQVLSTLAKKNALLESFDRRGQKTKKHIEEDVDASLREIIGVFEEFKHQLFVKVDEHASSFRGLMSQLEALSSEASVWAEARLRDVEHQANLKASADDMLYQQLNEIRLRKQTADEVEKALLAIKQKIDQMRLSDLAADILFLAEDKNPEIYSSSEASQAFERIRKDTRDRIASIEQTRIIRPFILDTHFTEPAPAPIPVQKLQTFAPAPLNIVPASLSPSPKFSSAGYATETRATPPEAKPSATTPLIAQQNHFFSDAIDLTTPFIQLEREIALKHPARLTCVLALSNKTVLLGTEGGDFLVSELTGAPPHQLLIKAHSSGIAYLSKTNERLILSSAGAPDHVLKLWDLSGLAGPDGAGPFQANGVLLISMLKDHSELIIGHAFLNDRNVISASRDGVVNVWDTRSPTPVARVKVPNNKISSFMLFSDKESFVVSTHDGLLYSYLLTKSAEGFQFVKQNEFREATGITSLSSFRGNNDIVIQSLFSGEAKLISKKTGLNLNSITGCKAPLSFFVLTCVKNSPDVYLLALEPYAFKIADVDHPEFNYVNTSSGVSFKIEGGAFPLWQIIDCVPRQKIIFVTINNATKPSTLLLWSLSPAK